MTFKRLMHLLIAGNVSLWLHACALAALAALSTVMITQQSKLGASPGVVVFEASFSEPEPAFEPVEIFIPNEPVVIQPHRATAVSRTFIKTPSSRVPLEQLLSRETLDRLLDDRGEKVPATTVPKRELVSEELASAENSSTAANVPRQPTNSKRPVTKVTAAVHSAPPSPQADAGLRTGPSFAGNRPPSYPATARRNGWEGKVMLRLTITASGTVSLVEVVQSSGHPMLDAEAVATVRTWRGVPATLNGQPVETVELLPVRFRLR